MCEVHQKYTKLACKFTIRGHRGDARRNAPWHAMRRTTLPESEFSVPSGRRRRRIAGSVVSAAFGKGAPDPLSGNGGDVVCLVGRTRWRAGDPHVA